VATLKRVGYVRSIHSRYIIWVCDTFKYINRYAMDKTLFS